MAASDGGGVIMNNPWAIIIGWIVALAVIGGLLWLARG